MDEQRRTAGKRLPVLKGPMASGEPPEAGEGVYPLLRVRWVRALLRFPLFYKILVANAAIVILGAIAGTATTIRFLRVATDHSPAELIVLFAAAGTVLSVLVNALILRLALDPLSILERTAKRVQDGDTDARAPYSPFADRDLTHLTWTFNGMLESLSLYRRQIREVAARALNASEEERKRIARELHDETAQTLAALLIRLRIARDKEDAAERDALLDEVRRELGAALEGVRRYARGLRPPALDELGLVPAIASYARLLEDAGAPAISIDADPVGGLLSDEAELALYRIVQEALSNAARHADADHVRIRIRRRPGEVRATVEDDGKGFDVAETIASNSNGLGLFGMQERAAYVGGDVEVTSMPGEGTRVVARVPIHANGARTGKV